MCLYLYVYSVSSPYLLVFGDDHIRGIRQQMVLQVDLVRHRAGAGLVLGKFSQSFYIVFINIIRLFVNGNSNYIQGFWNYY